LALVSTTKELANSKQLGNLSEQAASLVNTGELYRSQGQPQKSLLFYEQALPILQQLGAPELEAITLNNG